MEKRYLIDYLPVAEQDVTEIFEYISNDDPSSALTMLNRIDEAVDNLSLFPYSGVVPDDLRLQSLDYRILIVENYLVFYVVMNNVVEIRRVLHGKRKYDFLF